MLFVGAAACSQPPAPAMPVKVEKYCVTETGLSQFYLLLDFTTQTGKIRYKSFGQDALYEVRSVQSKDGKFVGKAVFARAATGETRGTPINFIYDPSDETLVDGAAVASCSNLQDSSLLDLPEPALTD
jgi:hypothetical protein